MRGVFWLSIDGVDHPATLNLVPRRTVYGERLVNVEGREYRIWDPFRSKLAAALLKGLRGMPFGPGDAVLYLGAASGTTSSHVSDVVGPGGLVYCVEFAPRPMRDLLRVCNQRPNMVPLLEDARHPERYRIFVNRVDAIYCDLAQPNQAEIMADNAVMFLKDGGWAMLAIKARSVDVTERPSKVYEREVRVLRGRGFDVLQVLRLEPYAIDHAIAIAIYGR
ncbi:TPA: fibrillarin-like rRNA/tRNA 2'-O-methyltransferase [Candidatus Bathyarchaeota archaeon]|nr:fibrillarin-like rRNA/tRNA 2'-O-methyltransferase [Candidatus Bathyarchaeota archaeon]